ncbi:aldo/keto reductase [Prevotella sp. 10(H)]|uniref:aldo/keto reductase n=1 Tax=Prevotella sp. 10(H) TaxID=1158294 RepID=UPI0004A717E2|nr:aldo/keto reductase [Prevotella sp. 10(H)]
MKKKGVNRRDFLRLSATVGAGALIVPGATASTLDRTEQPPKNKFPLRKLGRTGVELPILSMGVMRADNPNVVRAAYNAGLYHFDTAHGYQKGRNEEMLGVFFEGKPREDYFIATKVKIDYPLKENYEQDLNEKLDLSLQRLKMDYVDIFYAHAYDKIEEVKDEKIIAALKKIKESGKARFIGFSSHAHKPELLHAAIDTGIYDVILVSYNFKLKNLKETEDAIKRAAEAGIGIVAMKTMTGGVEDAEGKKKINAQACLKWVWKNKHITTIIPGFSNYDEFDECLAAAQAPELTQDEQVYLASLCDNEMMFCQQCKECVAQCPEKLPIPDIMRAYMYTYGYKYAQLSKETLEEINLAENACSNCDSCKVKCPSGFNVVQKIAAITPVMSIPNEFLT